LLRKYEVAHLEKAHALRGAQAKIDQLNLRSLVETSLKNIYSAREDGPRDATSQLRALANDSDFLACMAGKLGIDRTSKRPAGRVNQLLHPLYGVLSAPVHQSIGAMSIREDSVLVDSVFCLNGALPAIECICARGNTALTWEPVSLTMPPAGLQSKPQQLPFEAATTRPKKPKLSKTSSSTLPEAATTQPKKQKLKKISCSTLPGPPLYQEASATLSGDGRPQKRLSPALPVLQRSKKFKSSSKVH